MRYIVAVISVLFLYSCSGPTYEEVVAETNQDGTPKRIQFYEGEGESRVLAKEAFYYANGNVRVEGHYNEEGKKDGKWTYWYEDGNKWSEGYFSDGQNDGKRTTWHEGGEMHYEGTYDMGKRVGVWKFYSEQGDLLKEIDYDKTDDQE